MTTPRQPTARPLHAMALRALPAALAVGALTLIATQPAGAQSNRIMCSQPVKPTCVESDLTYEDEQRIARCERDLENYVNSVEEYLTCLDQKAEAQKEAMEELRENFRCNADPDKSC